MKWGSAAKKLKKYKVVLIKDYVEIINTALEQKADWHFHNNKMVKNKIGKKVPIDKAIGEFCLMIKDCVEQQYKQQRKRS
jgi:hypothetical protein|tara:strand:- start:41 stop:280 length:240 start_codon:yes stop_codon:yes gene_type:complete